MQIFRNNPDSSSLYLDIIKLKIYQVLPLIVHPSFSSVIVRLKPPYKILEMLKQRSLWILAYLVSLFPLSGPLLCRAYNYKNVVSLLGATFL